MRRITYKALGLGCVGLGIAGAVLPLLPTTIFFILAAGFFARSSPELERRILTHPVFGPSVIAWREHGAIPKRAKFFAFTGMAAGYLMFYLGSRPSLWLALLVAIIMAGCALYVGTRPSGPKPASSQAEQKHSR